MEQNNNQALTPETLLNSRYIVKKVLGRGSMGLVYCVYDLKTNKDLAIKELFPFRCCKRTPGQKNIEPYSQNAIVQFQDYKNYFIQEAGIMSQLSGCPNLISTGELFEENNTCYFTMELLRGESLKALVTRQKMLLQEEEAVYIADQVLNALSYLHQHDIIHRDICCDNIFITDANEIKVIDLGAAAYLNNFGGKRTYSIILKRSYAPPEQYVSHGKLGPYSDIYALGAVLYRAVTGINIAESIERIQQDNVIPPDQINGKISRWFSTVIMKALRLDAKERFQTAEEFRASLYERTVQVDHICFKKTVRKYIFMTAGLIILVTGCIIMLVMINL